MLLLLSCAMLIVPGGQFLLSALPAGKGGASAYLFVPGRQQVFAVDFQSSSRADFRVLLQGDNARGEERRQLSSGLSSRIASRLKGTLTETVVRVGTDTIDIAFSIDPVVLILTINDRNVSAQARAIAMDLRNELFIRLRPSGAILSVSFSPSVSPLSQRYARSFIALMQFVVPDSSRELPSGWVTQEDDAAGRCEAVYSQMSHDFIGTADRGVVRVQKKRTRYILPYAEPAYGDARPSGSIVPRGAITGTIDRGQGIVTAVHGTQSQESFIGTKSVALASLSIHLSCTLVDTISVRGRDSLENALALRERPDSFVPLAARMSPVEAETRLQKKQLADATLGTLLEELQGAENLDRQKFTLLYLNTKAFVYVYPESCFCLLPLLDTARAEDAAMRIVPPALSEVGHPEAQHVLVQAVRDRAEDQVFVRLLLSSILSVKRATEETEALLWEYVARPGDPESSSMAALALGTQARTLSVQSPERSAAIVRRLEAELQASASPQLRSQFLLALGNAGQSSSFPAIAPFAGDTSWEMRAIAVHCMRFIDAPRADSLLARVIVYDRESRVRTAAAEALGYRNLTPATYKAQKRALLSDTSSALRLQVLDNFIHARRDIPDLAVLAKSIASASPDSAVRAAALQIVKELQEHPPERRIPR